MKLTNVTLKLPPDELKALRGHGFYAKFIVDERCAHADTVPCDKEHRCGARTGSLRLTCGVFKSEHHEMHHKYEAEVCSMSACSDCEESLG